MSDTADQQTNKPLGSDTAQALEAALKRLQLHLREAEVQAPMQIFQMIEELRGMVRSDSAKAKEGLTNALKRIAASEEEFLDWLELDWQLLERKLLKALSLAADPSQLDPDAWRKTKD